MTFTKWMENTASQRLNVRAPIILIVTSRPALAHVLLLSMSLIPTVLVYTAARTVNMWELPWSANIMRPILQYH
jgi:hypothetical protein